MDTKNENKPTLDIDIIASYVQLVLHTLQKSGSEIDAKSIRNEVKMFYEKFGNREVKRLANIIMKEKKENK